MSPGLPTWRKGGLLYVKLPGGKLHRWLPDGPFIVDGIHYDRELDDIALQPMIDIRDHLDGCDQWRCRANRPPPTDAELDEWVRSEWSTYFYREAA